MRASTFPAGPLFTMNVTHIKSELLTFQKPGKAEFHLRFFKCGPGEYGEGDEFIGVSVPDQRKVAKKYYKDVSHEEIQQLLNSPIHEHRLTALLCMNYRFEKFVQEQELLYNVYCKNTHRINNWDLVDTSAPNIVGAYLLDKSKDQLYAWAKSSLLWERRIAIIATWRFIKHNQFDDTMKLAEILLEDKHDLMHKSVGWMLREVGKKDETVLTTFLDKKCTLMPRTMLRYSIEKLSQEQKKMYMKR